MTGQRSPAERAGGAGWSGDGPAVRARPDWLALRRDADTEARDAGAAGLLELLVDELRRRGGDPVRVVDVGAGTGANHAYLSPRLPLGQRWVVVDHDAELLGHPAHGDALRVQAGVRDLVAVVDDLLDGGSGGPVLLTCAALLDVLSEEELGRLAEAVERSGGPALLSLSVTGEVRWSPAHEADTLVAALFDAHQRRGGRPGPSAPAVLSHDLWSRGLRVLTASTPWRLDARRPALLGRWLDERVAAASAQQDGHADGATDIEDWHAGRRQQLRSAGLAAHVQHVDLLVLPRRARG